MKPNTHYQVREDDPNEYIFVSDSPKHVTDNFTQSELYNARTRLSEHPLAINAILAVQAIRDYFGFPITITSTYRNYIPSDGVAPATTSPHMLGQGIDFAFTGPEEEDLYIAIRNDWDQKGELFQTLWGIGVRGFGSYDTFIHIDVVVSELYAPFRAKRTSSYKGELYARWNKMKRLRYRSAKIVYGRNTQIETISSNIAIQTAEEMAGSVAGYVAELLDGEDRGKDFTTTSLLYSISVVLTILLVIVVPMAVFAKIK